MAKAFKAIRLYATRTDDEGHPLWEAFCTNDDLFVIAEIAERTFRSDEFDAVQIVVNDVDAADDHDPFGGVIAEWRGEGLTDLRAVEADVWGEGWDEDVD